MAIVKACKFDSLSKSIVMDLLSAVILILVVLIIIAIMRASGRTETTGHWQYLFEGVQFSVEDFLRDVKFAVNSRAVPGVSTSQTTFPQAGILSIQRLYLKVERKDYIFYVGAGPFGNSFFVSWWLQEKLGLWPQFWAQFGRVGRSLADRSKSRTYYQLDTAIAFRQLVQNSVMEVVDRMTQTKGIRLTEAERKPSLSKFLE